MLSEGLCGLGRNELLERFDRPPADSCRHFVYSDADIPELIVRVDVSNERLLLREERWLVRKTSKLDDVGFTLRNNDVDGIYELLIYLILVTL